MRAENPKIVGIIPAAGHGTRLHPFRYAKELLPIAYTEDQEGRLQPVLALEHSIQGMRAAGIGRCLIVTSPTKQELMRVLGDGSDFGIRLAYVNQVHADGLLRAVATCLPWIEDNHACLALPDTIIRPKNAIEQLCLEMEAKGSDLQLGVFPTQHPEQLGPVHFNENGDVFMVEDKPKEPTVYNTWAIAVWSPTISRLLMETLATLPEGLDKPLGDIYHLAAVSGYSVNATYFKDGGFHDIGTPKGLTNLILRHEESHPNV
jgi:glucose-1-phosphate thymidylyltransferase